ncbi:MAG: family 16 glycoside hydrolase [Candidatus Binatia bacterium]
MSFLSVRKLAFSSTLFIAAIAWPAEIEAGSLRLTWSDTSTNEAGFKVERLNGSSFSQIGTVGANVTSYTNSGLTSGVTYCYRVRAYSSGGTSAPSNQACGNATDSGGTVSLDGSTGGSTSGTSSTETGSSSTGGSTTTSQAGANWSDYRVTLKMRSNDDDGIGVMFRYVDDRNYYRFSWSRQEGYRRLEKIRNGTATVLAKDSVRYVVGRAYEVEILVNDSLLKVIIDGATVFSVRDSSFDGGTIALYSNYNKASVFDDIMVRDLATGAVLLSDNFNDGNFIGWTIVDEGTDEGPSAWSVKNGALVQSGNLGSYTPTRRGTYALYTKRNWADYRATLTIKSMDNDAIGAMFRYVDDRNYYRFSWDKQRSRRRLERFRNGARAVLSEDAVSYVTGRTYELEIVADGSRLQVRIDGNLIFSDTDGSFDRGGLALYSWYNQGTIFDEVLVEDLSTGKLLLWDNFNDGDLTGWTIIDEGPTDGPSEWSADDGALTQGSNIGGGNGNKPGTFALY